MVRNSWWWRHPTIVFCIGLVLATSGTIISLVLEKRGIENSMIPLVVMVLIGGGFIVFSWIVMEYDWLCPKCGYRTYIRHRYCYKCGSMMYAVKVEPSRCPNGHPIERYMNFCEKCGVRLYEEVEE
jgi:hypothetical protein